jgi:DNA-binding XRE family transcriptional regulator
MMFPLAPYNIPSWNNEQAQESLVVVKSIHDPTYQKLIDRLAARRKEVSMTQIELAEKLGWPQSAVSKLETYERRLDLLETIRICELLNWTLADLTREG